MYIYITSLRYIQNAEVVGCHGVFVVGARSCVTAAVSRGLRLTSRDVTLGGFFMESARRNEAHPPGLEIFLHPIKKTLPFFFFLL